jgi:hypothetical protein
MAKQPAIEIINIPQLILGIAIGILMTTLVVVIVTLFSLQESESANKQTLNTIETNLNLLQTK